MNPLPPCPYKVLGVAKDAQLPEVRTAYRKLVLKCHPDKVQDPALKAAKQDEFQKVQQAYELLSDENERSKYDDQIKLMELQKRRNVEANTSAARTPPRYYEVRTAEPRPDSYKTKSSSRAPSTAGSKMYSNYPPSRSYEDEIHSSARAFEDAARSARRAASYDDKPSKRDDERERDRERRRRKEDQEEKERLARQADKAEKLEREARRAERKRLEKLQEKERKRESEDKRKHKSAYVEPYDDDEYRSPAKADRKKTSSSTKKHDDKEKRERERPPPVHDDEPPMDKTQMAMMDAVRYMTSARQKGQPQLSRSQTYQESTYRYAPPAAVPTPPSAQDSPFQPPPISPISVEEDDTPRRSAAKPSPRRSSETPKAREKTGHKKSSSGPKEAPATSPIAVDLSSARVPPSFAKAGTTPPMAPESPPRKTQLPRANTMREADYTRPPPQPTISRSQTYHYAGDHEIRSSADPRGAADPRGRSRSRLQAQVSEESDSDDEDQQRRYREVRRRERRHKTHSPEPIPADYPPPPPLSRATTARYAVNNGRTVPMHAEQAYSYRDESPPRKSKGSYYPSAHVRVAEVRPPMPSREGAYSSSGGGVYFPKVKTTKSYTPDDVQYSNIPHHRGYHEEAYA